MKSILILTGFSFACSVFGAPSDAADAAQQRDWQTVRALAGRKADVNAAQPDGTTALQWAAHWNDLDAVKALLSSGANPKLANRYGVTPLSEAAASGNAPMI
jgi:ankyrin repeat protein